MRTQFMPVLILAVVLGTFNFSATRAADPSLVGWWKLDDGAGTIAADSSGRSVAGTLFGNPEWMAKAVYGGGLLFDGTDDYIFIDGHFQLAEYTMTVWFRVDSLAQRDILSAYATGVQHGILLEVQAAGTLRYLHRYPLGTGGGTNVYSTASYADGNWYHAAIVKSAGQIALYIDGEQIGAAADTSVFDPTDSFGLAVGILDNEREVARLFLGPMDDIRVYDRALEIGEIRNAMAGLGPDSEKAGDPVPADEATDVPREVILNWKAGRFAATHDVYLGTAFADVNDADRANPMGVLLSQGQADVSYDPPAVLDFSQTYFWRVDEVNAAPDNTIFKGDVWSFTTEPFAYAVPGVVATSNGISDAGAGPENTVNGSGIDADDQHSTAAADMWLANPPAEGSLWVQYDLGKVYKLHQMLVWNYNVTFESILGFGCKNVTVEYCENGADWTALGDFEFARATAKATYAANTAVDFAGVPARFVRLKVNSGWGMMGQFGLSEVRFLFIPAQAREPQPADGAVDVEVGTALAWRSGREAVSHEVYLSADPDALALAATVDSPTFAAALEFGRTYYWQVVEVNEADAVTAWAGDLWSFSTQEYALIDDFESYTDDVEAATTIFDTWLDGWVNDTGSTVGYLTAPFAEKTIVHGGAQSMPLAYDNSASPFCSEAWREFETAQNWLVHGADTLVLYVRGIAPAFLESADGGIVMNAIGTDIWNNADEFRFAYKSLSGDGSIVARVDSVFLSDGWAKAGVMIRESLAPGSKHAMVVVTPSNGVSFQRRIETDGASTSTDATGLVAPHWVKLTRTNNTFSAQRSADGQTWIDIEVSPALTIPMAANAYVGLAVTSHSATVATGADFSNISTAGNVTGAWQVAEIGVEQPDTGNAAERLYVAIEDNAGKVGVVTNPDALATARGSWNQWQIPFTELTGVNLSRVRTMTIGVGSRTSPAAGGTGLIYIDDIGFGRGTTE